MNSDLLEHAIKARVPLVHVTTDDPVHVFEVVSFIAGQEAKAYKPPEAGSTESGLKADGVYVWNSDADPKMWRSAKKIGASIVCVNSKKSVLHVDCGVMLPPKAQVMTYLKDWLLEYGPTGWSIKEAETAAQRTLASFSGLTIKEVLEVVKLCMTRVKFQEDLTTTVVNKVRQGLASKAKGISQVEVDDEFYDCPTELADWLAMNKQFFLNPVHPKLTPRGLLFDGPPGTGKTAGAKEIAREFGLPLYRVDIGAMKGKYVGDSEGALQAALAQLDQASPCVAIMDEVEKVFTSTGDSGVTTSMLGQILWWLQEHKTQVFTVMTTNNKMTIPPELFRDGRVNRAMTFNGLDGAEQAMAFASAVFERMAKDVKLEFDPVKITFDLHQMLDGAFTPDMRITQAKVTSLVQELVKIKILGSKK